MMSQSRSRPIVLAVSVPHSQCAVGPAGVDELQCLAWRCLPAHQRCSVPGQHRCDRQWGNVCIEECDAENQRPVIFSVLDLAAVLRCDARGLCPDSRFA